MGKQTFKICFLLALFGLMLIAPLARVSAETQWTLQVSNISNVTTTFSYNQLLAMPETTVAANEYCYGTLVASGDWGGVSLSYLLDQVGVDPSVTSINLLASDGYTVSLPIQDAMQSDVIIAYELNGSPLSVTLQLVLPGYNGSFWIYLIISITMSASAVSPTANSPFLSGPEGIIPPTLSQPSPQPTLQVSPTPTTPLVPTPTLTVTPSASAIQPTPEAFIPGFSLVDVYGIAIGIIVVLVAAVYLAYRIRRTRNGAILRSITPSDSIL